MRQCPLKYRGKLEASPGIEPGYEDLQSSASPLRHEAIHAVVCGVCRGV